MAVADYKKYLAESVLNDRRPVSYRLLGRALRVHSTIAKQMLYDFHRTENQKKPSSVNATYVVTGIPIPTPAATSTDEAANGSGDGDDIMQSSPYIGSSMPNQDVNPAETVSTTSIMLVREEDLEEAKSTFQSISSIYVYSLQPTVLQDLNVLVDVSRETAAAHAQEDPLEYGKQWGMIQNKNVKRRTGMRPPAPTPAPAPAPAKTTIPSKRPAQEEAKPQPKPELKKENTDSDNASTRESTPASNKPTEKLAPKKNSLFSSFAKAKPKQKKEASATPAESAEPSGAEDVVLDDASEDEPEELFPDSGKSTTTSTRESRKEREDKLRQMMEDEDEDEEMPDTTEPADEPPVIDQPPTKPADLKVEATVQGGRRRGKRQVMKKKTVKDDEGYLVTVEEPAWESFSEDEAPPPKKKPAVSAPKGKPKAGQGSIMSFFGKK